MPELEKLNQKPIQNENQKIPKTFPLENGYYRWSIEGEPIEIFFKQKPFQNMWDHCFACQFTPPQGEQAGGRLLGTVQKAGDIIYKIYIEYVYSQKTMQGEGERSILKTTPWQPSKRSEETLFNMLKIRKTELGWDSNWIEIGFFHSYVDDESIKFLNTVDNRRFWDQYNKPWQIILLLQVKHAKGAFFHWHKTDEGYGIMNPDEEFEIPKEYQYSKVRQAAIAARLPLHSINPQVQQNEPIPKVSFQNFAQFTQEDFVKSGYEYYIKKYQQEFERLVSLNTLLEPLRQYIPAMIEKGIQAVKKIKTNFASQRTTATPEEIKKIFTEQWIKPFIGASHFPLQGTDHEIDYWKKQLEFAFATLCSIELMNDTYPNDLQK